MEFLRETDPARKTFEEQVHEVLRRVDAPEGFADRVVARARQRNPSAARVKRGNGGGLAVLIPFTRPAWRMVYPAAALLAITAGAVHMEHRRSEVRRADQAAAQFDTALQVTHHALDHVSEELQTSEFGQVQRALENSGGAR